MFDKFLRADLVSAHGNFWRHGNAKLGTRGLPIMSPDSTPPEDLGPRERGSQSYKDGHAFEDRVAEAYRLLGYRVEPGRLFEGRQVDIFLELDLADLHIRRAVECKVGVVTSEDLDKFLIKLHLVQRKYPDAKGTIVGALSFTDSVTSHAAAEGIQLTLYRDLSARILDGPSYAQMLVREIKENERYQPSLFVEPLIGYETLGEGKKGFEVVTEWLEDSRWNQLTLLGDVGTGKSFFCRMIALRLAQDYLQQPTDAPLPLLIDLRNADREFSLEGLVLTHFATHGLSRATFDVFQFLLSEGKIVLILDGFDEMASKVTPVITTRNFHELSRCVKRDAKVLLTCRTHYFKSRTEEEEVVLGGSGRQLSDVARDLYWDLIARSGFRIAYLRPFGMPQVEEYVEKACPDTSAIVLKKIHNIYNLAELSQRPLLLDMIVKSIDKLTTAEVNSAQLYEIFTGAWIHRDLWRDLMRPEEKLKFLTMLARLLWEQEKTSVDYHKLQEYVEAELKGAIDSPQKLIELDAEIRTASFLVRDDPGHYGFAHSSFAEYFLARELATHISAGAVATLAIRRLTNEVVDFLLWMVDKAALEGALAALLAQPYQPQLSENALVVLYRLRRNLLVEEKTRGGDNTKLKVEMPSGVQLQGAKLAEVNIEGAILRSACLDGADLSQCTARGVDLMDSSLRMASVRKGDFQDACLQKVDATNAVLTEVNCHNADVRGCDFTGADLTSSIFTVKKLSGAVFQDSSFDFAVLPAGREVAILSRAKPLEVASGGKDREQVLLEAYRLARQYAAHQGAGAEAADIASDVVVFLLSNPTELLRLSQQGPKLGEFVRTLTWRRMGAVGLPDPTEQEDWLHEQLNAEETEDQDSSGADDALERTAEFVIERDLEAWGLVTVPSGAGGRRPRESDDLLEVLGTALSEEALRMLILRYVYEETIEEIAHSRGLSDVEVVRQLNKARELARKALRPLAKHE